MMKEPTPFQGRLYVVGAAVFWSLSGAFVKLLREPNALGLAEPPVEGLVIAFYRTVFATALLSLSLRRNDICFRRMMLFMVLSFAAMNALFVSSLTLGTSANAIILQYTAPLWMYLASVFCLGEPASRRNTIALIIAMTGVAVIVVDAWQQQTLTAVVVALSSGLSYAGVILGLRVLRGVSSQWLTVMNHGFAAVSLLPVVFLLPAPTPRQIAFLAVFGTVQMGFPYWLVSRGLRILSPQEVGTLTLIEPLLNPVITYLVVGEVPATSTFIGGALILAALVWRYLPARNSSEP